MSAKWENRSFLAPSPEGTPTVTLIWPRLPWWKSGSPVHHWGRRKIQAQTAKRVRGTVWLYPHHLSPQAAQLGAQGALGGLWPPARRENGSMGWAPSILGCAGHRHWGAFLSCPTCSLRWAAWPEGRKQLTEEQPWLLWPLHLPCQEPVAGLSLLWCLPASSVVAWALQGHQTEADPNNHFTDTIRKPANEPLGDLVCQPLQLAHGYP